MAEPTDPAGAEKGFLDVKAAEIVDGPEVIAGKVSSAMRDADRFGLPHVKPPLSEALGRVKTASGAAEAESPKQDALSGQSAGTDERAGSAEVLKPTGKDPS